MLDGVIKYNFDFQKSAPLEKKLFIDIENVRERLFALGFIGEQDGIGFGNISQRINHKSFVITGTQTGHLSNLEAEHFSLVEEYNDCDFFIKSSGASKPSSEALTHGTIYKLNSEIGAVIHIHSKKLWQFMLDNEYLKTKKVPYGTTKMIAEVNAIYKNIIPLSNSKFVMTGHEDGIICFAENIRLAEKILFDIVKDYFDK